MRCETCQPLLLDHLYGLLDPAETAALEAHLTGCVGCSAARTAAAREAGLFARAAKHSFPTVRFVPPTDAVPSTLARPAARERVGARWAVAAAVWALVPAALIPLATLSNRAGATRNAADGAFASAKQAGAELTAATAGRKQADARYAAAKQNTEQALAAWVAAERAAEDAAKAKPAEVLVTRPESLQPGAPNDFAVSVRPRGDALAGRPVTAEVRDGAGKVLVTQALSTTKTEDQPVRLPADVWATLAPNAELFLAVSTTTPAGARIDLVEPVRLFGPVYATMLVTDRATYRPGERVLFRSLTLDRTTFRPPPHEQALTFSLRRRDGSEVPGTTLYGTTGLVRVADGNATPVLGPDGQPVRGVGVGEIALPADLTDGEYLLTLAEVPGRGSRPAAMTAPVTRTVRVESGATGRYEKAITFGPAAGQKVTAFAELKFGKQAVSGADVSAVATADGAPNVIVKVLDKQTDAAGKARIEVTLPAAKDMPRGDVRLRVTFRTKDATESVAERVPVAGKDAIVEFFPEGGTFVAGVTNRVYVRATTPAGVPVSVRGTVSENGVAVAKVEFLPDDQVTARGLGVVIFAPKADARYALALDDKPGKSFDLPPAAADGVAMTVLEPVTAPGRPVRVRLVSAKGDRNLVVGAYTRGRLADTKTVLAKAGEPVEVSLLAGADARGGVVRVTVFEDAGGLRPVVERLAFRRPGEVLNLALGAASTGADGALSLPVTATDEKGNPAAAILWAAVVNAASAPGAKDRSLPTHFLLAGEIETPDDLEHADFLLTNAPAASAGLDLVLATQGWRRFVEQGTGPVARRTPATERLLAMNGATPIGPDASPAHRRLFEAHWPRYEESVRELDAAQAERAAAARAQGPDVAALLTAYESQRRQTAELAAAAEAAAAPLVASRAWIGLSAGALAVLAICTALVGATRPGGARGLTPIAASAVGAGLLALFLGQMAPDEITREYALDNPPALAPAPPVPGPAVAPASLPVAPPPQLARINRDGKIEPPPFFSGQGTEKVTPKGVHIVPIPAPAPPVVIPDSELRRGHTPAGAAMRMSAPAVKDATPADRSADAALRRAADLAVPIEAIFPDAAKRDVVFERLRTSVPWVPPLVVREYAAPRPGAGSADPDTLLWQPLIVLPGDGKTTLSFFPGHAAGGYEVVVAGHTPDGRIGTVRRVVPAAPK